MKLTEPVDLDKILAELKHAAASSENEEALRIKASSTLEAEVITKFGLSPGRYEYTVVHGGRLDALYGHVLIEYKSPGKMSKEVDITKAKEQLIAYIEKEAKTETSFPLFLGVILSDKIAFVRFNEKTKTWLIRGPYDLNKETVLKLVEAIRGLGRKKLAVDELLRDFGPRSTITTRIVRILYGKIISSKSPKVEALFNDWKRLFSQVCAYSPDKLKGLKAEYELTNKIDYDAMLFVIHTYYALLMKLLAAEVAYLFGASKWLKSYIAELEDANMKGLTVFKKALEDLESGGVFRKFLSITNFIEGDYFSWYLEEMDTETADAIADLAKGLAEYEPATPVLEPEYTRDLLKKLYQNLLPKKIRHDLGEYYTPDWLADLLLDETDITLETLEKIANERGDATQPLNLRILDPACGSGTFLVLAMKRLREYSEKEHLKDVAVSYMLNNVIGFDLNPLAVLTARTNYLLAIADLLTYAKGPIEIPVYLADSIMVETRTTLTGVSYAIRTYVGVFELPKTVVDRGILSRLLEALDRYVRLRYKTVEFCEVVKNELELNSEELGLAENLYRIFLKLEQQGRNHVWTSIIKNAFAPLTIINSYGKFDRVIGNPPWINWESLPESYRNETKRLWDLYDLLKKTKGLGLGKTKRDMAMLFVTRCLDRYVKDTGELSFLIPFTVYKTQAGAGFRSYVSRKANISRIHDLVDLFPFEGAINRTSLIVIRKDGKTNFPIRCIMWHNSKNRAIGQEASLDEVLEQTRQLSMIISPIAAGRTETPWMIITKRAFKTVQRALRPSKYKAHSGVFTGLDAVYWVSVRDKTETELVVSNIAKTAKAQVKKVELPVEKDLLYPLIRGKDTKMWYSKPSGYIVAPVEKNGETISFSKLATRYPRTFAFFKSFYDELIGRKAEPYKTKLKRLHRNKELREPPFYMLFNVETSLSPYKVVWKHISGAISGKAEFSSSVITPVADEYLDRKVVLPSHGLVLISCESETEAHYLCALLNSSLVRLIVSSYLLEVHITTDIPRTIYLEKFDSEDRLHRKLSDLSMKAHTLSQKYHEKDDQSAWGDLRRIEEEVDAVTAKVYKLSDEELVDIKKALEMLKSGNVKGGSKKGIGILKGAGA
jgi:methylase of polypeptide subunit release factors